jgi:hypothetical protein
MPIKIERESPIDRRACSSPFCVIASTYCVGMLDTDFDPTEIAADHIPPGLDAMAPGPVLAGFLSAIDVDTVSGYDRVVVLRAHQRLASHYQAHTYTDMAAITQALANDGEASETELAAAEIRAALNLTRRAADIELSFALDLRRRLPQVHQLLADGAIDLRRARTIDNATCHLTIATARGVIERIGNAAADLTTGELRARIKKLCIQAEAEEAKKRYSQAVEGRRVITEPTVDGTAHIHGLDLPPDKAAAITRRINGIARSLRSGGETRTMDQLRADVYMDLLQGTEHTTRGRGVVHMTVDLDTLAGLSEHPGELNGFAPIISDIAKQIAEDQPDAEWRYTVTDTPTGQPITTGITRRRPTASQQREVATRDQHCVFPGCRMPASDCDIDHTTTWAENGPTNPNNLATLCRTDHRLKHNGWTYQRLSNGAHQWTSPLGHTYTTWKDPP